MVHLEKFDLLQGKDHCLNDQFALVEIHAYWRLLIKTYVVLNLSPPGCLAICLMSGILLGR